MIRNDQELKVTLERIAHFQRQVTHLEKSKPIRLRLPRNMQFLPS